MISGICLILSQNFLTLLLSYGLFCIAETITFLLSFVYASAVFEKDYIGTSMGIFDSLMDLSLFVGPILAISLYKTSGILEPVFILAVFPAFLALLAGGFWLSKEK
jgi:hypothetical protein